MTTDLRNDTVMATSGQELTERMLTMGCFSGLFAQCCSSEITIVYATHAFPVGFAG